MQHYFRSQTCNECHSHFDGTEKYCPCCGAVGPRGENFNTFIHHTRVSWIKQLILFLIGWAGFQVVGTIISYIVIGYFNNANPGITDEELLILVSDPKISFAVTGAGYLAIFIALLLLMIFSKKIVALLKSFASLRAFGFAMAGFAMVFAYQIVYNMIASSIMQSCGIDPSVNANESSIRAMTQALPVLCFICFGFIGPFCEELTYRVGLFGLLCRGGKVLGFILGGLVFGLIHFDFGVLVGDSKDAIIIELLNIPNYIGAGLILCFIYDKAGFGASCTVHVLNNVTSLVLTLISKEA